MSFIGFIPAGAFKTISSAYQTSTNASSIVTGASGLLAESRESRRSATGLEGGLAESTAKLLTLKGEIASSPNLTPVINKVKIQSGFLISPLRTSSFQEGPVALRRQKSPPAVMHLSSNGSAWQDKVSVRRETHPRMLRQHPSNLLLWDISGELPERPLPGDHRY